MRLPKKPVLLHVSDINNWAGNLGGAQQDSETEIFIKTMKDREDQLSRIRAANGVKDEPEVKKP